MTTEMNLTEITASEMPPTEGTSAVGSELDLGKFKSVESLMNAYTNLEKEFTKRSQLLREYESNAIEQSPKTILISGDNEDSAQSDCSVTTALVNDVTEYIPESADNQATSQGDAVTDDDSESVATDIAHNRAELVDRLLQDEDIKQQLYTKLLDEVSENTLPRTGKNKGQMLLTPIRKPRDIAEAGRIAQELIQTRRM